MQIPSLFSPQNYHQATTCLAPFFLKITRTQKKLSETLFTKL